MQTGTLSTEASFPDWTEKGKSKEKTQSKIPWKTRRISLSVNSVTTGILAFLLIYWLQFILGSAVGVAAGLDSIVYSDRLIWGLNIGKWNTKSLVFPALTNPLVCLTIGLLAHKYFWKKQDTQLIGQTALRVFFAWLAFYGIGLFFALIIQGLIMDRQFAYALRPLKISKNILIGISPLFVIAMLVQGRRFSQIFASTFVSTAMSEPKRRVSALTYVLIIPFGLHFLLFLLIHYPISFQSAYIFGALGLMVLSTFLYGRSSSLVPEFISVKTYKSELIYLIIAIVLLVWGWYWKENPISIYRLIKVHMGIGV